MQHSNEHSELLLQSSGKRKDKWAVLLVILVLSLAVACLASSRFESRSEESLGVKEQCKPADCSGCTATEEHHRRRLPGQPGTPGSSLDCKSCCAGFAALLKGEKVLQIVPRPQAQPQTGYAPMQFLPPGGEQRPSPYAGASDPGGSAHGGAEMQHLFRPGSSSAAGPSGIYTPSSGSVTPRMLTPPGGSTPYKLSPMLGPAPGKSVSLKIPIKEDAVLPPPIELSQGPANPDYIDVFLIRHGESTANEIKEKAKRNELIEVAYKRKIFAKDLYDGCNKSPLPFGIYPLDCSELLQDARLTDKGMEDAAALYSKWNTWAISSFEPKIYEPEDAAIIVSPLRRSAVTGLMPFKDVLDKVHVEVEFDFRELQYTLRSGLFAENQCMNYPETLQEYVKELGLEGPTFHYHVERLARQGFESGKKYVTEIWESDEDHPLAPGCPKNTEHFQGAIQRAAEYARKHGKKYVVVGTHSYVIKCTNREFSLSQTNGKPDSFNPYYKMGGYLLENGAVERIVWDMKNKKVVGPPKMVWKGLSREKYFNRFYWPTPPASPGRSPQDSPLPEKRVISDSVTLP